MPTNPDLPTNMPEAVIQEKLEAFQPNYPWGYDDLIRELDRRAANRQARATNILSIVAVVVSVAALLVTLAKP